MSARRAVYLASECLDPPTSGGRRHGAALLVALQEHMDVVLLTPDVADAAFPSWAAAVDRLKARRSSQPRRALDLVRGLVTGRPVMSERAERAGLPAALGDVIATTSPELVVLARPFFGTFIDVVRAGGAAVAVDADESLVRVARSIARSRAPFSSRVRALLDLAAVGRMERREYPRADQVWVTSNIERGHFVRYLAPDRVFEMPNVVLVGDGTAMPAPPSDVAAVAYVGWYGYPPNELAAVELAVKIMPRVRALGGPKRLVLIGRDPTVRMRRLARDGEVEITGEVPDVLPPLRRAGLLAVPLRAGGGTRVKILEAAAAGVPIVSTRFGAEGLGLGAGKGVLLAEDPDEFARAIVRVATDPDLRRDMALQARAALVQSHSPARLAEALSMALACLDRR